MTDGEILADKLHIEHIPVPVTPATIAGDSDRVRVGDFLPTRFITGEILCQREAVLFSIGSYIADISTAIVIGLYHDVYILYALTFC